MSTQTTVTHALSVRPCGCHLEGERLAFACPEHGEEQRDPSLLGVYPDGLISWRLWFGVPL